MKFDNTILKSDENGIYKELTKRRVGDLPAKGNHTLCSVEFFKEFNHFMHI